MKDARFASVRQMIQAMAVDIALYEQRKAIAEDRHLRSTAFPTTQHLR
jgi:hypothetical protein